MLAHLYVPRASLISSVEIWRHCVFRTPQQYCTFCSTVQKMMLSYLNFKSTDAALFRLVVKKGADDGEDVGCSLIYLLPVAVALQ
jgi:hypothetical protein